MGHLQKVVYLATKKASILFLGWNCTVYNMSPSHLACIISHYMYMFWPKERKSIIYHCLNMPLPSQLNIFLYSYGFWDLEWLPSLSIFNPILNVLSSVRVSLILTIESDEFIKVIHVLALLNPLLVPTFRAQMKGLTSINPTTLSTNLIHKIALNTQLLNLIKSCLFWCNVEIGKKIIGGEISVYCTTNHLVFYINYSFCPLNMPVLKF